MDEGVRVARAHRRLVPVRQPRRQGRVLVLGAGFIGAHAARRLVADGFRVDVVTRSEPRPEISALLAGTTVAIGDISSMGSVTSLVAEVDHVVYAVGSSSPVESDLDPASDVSLVVPPVVRLLELLRLRPSVGMTYLSSGGAIYGNVESPLVSEGAIPEPISSYGILKLTAEMYLSSYSRLYNVPVRILRVSNAYGPGQLCAKGQGILPRLMQCADTGTPFPVFGDGSDIRDYVYIDDVAAAVSAMVIREVPYALFNLGSGVGHSVLDVIRLVEEVSGRRIEVDYLPRRSFDVRSIVLDVSRLRSQMEYTPISLADGVRRTWAARFAEPAAELVPSDLVRVPQALA